MRKEPVCRQSGAKTGQVAAQMSPTNGAGIAQIAPANDWSVPAEYVFHF